MRQWLYAHKRELKTILLLTIVVALLASVYKDAYIIETMPVDMRNRVIGSRMMMHGESAYFYTWHNGDTLAYYDPMPPFSLAISRVTSTPFFHSLFGLIADLPQFQLNIFWFFLQYFLLAFCLLLMALSTPPDKRLLRCSVMAIITVAFTYTFGWHLHVHAGQNYILIPAMAAGCYYSIFKGSGWLYLCLFAVFAGALVLLRPTAVLFFLPFLFYLKTYKKWALATASFFILYAVFVLASPVQKKNWVDYFESVSLHVKYHQGQLPPLKAVPYTSDSIHQLEGTDLEFGGGYYWSEQHFPEYRNFYILVAEVIGKKVTVLQMTIIGIACCLLLLWPLLLVKKRSLSAPPAMLLLLGFIVYNTYEFFSPVSRLDYQWVQFIFPLLLAVVYSKRLYLVPIALFIVGILLNTASWQFINIERRTGEGLVIVSMLFMVYRELIMQYTNEKRFHIKDELYIV